MVLGRYSRECFAISAGWLDALSALFTALANSLRSPLNAKEFPIWHNLCCVHIVGCNLSSTDDWHCFSSSDSGNRQSNGAAKVTSEPHRVRRHGVVMRRGIIANF